MDTQKITKTRSQDCLGILHFEPARNGVEMVLHPPDVDPHGFDSLFHGPFRRP